MAAVNVILDVAVIALPVRQLFKLQMMLKQKLLISIMFLCGFL